MGLIDAPTLAEKLRAPRALTALGASLFAEPAEGSTTAWLAWWSGAAGELAEAIERARSAGATRLSAGGPPGNYVESGVDASDADRVAALAAAGFTIRGEHLDLRVGTEVAPRPALEATVARTADDLGPLIAPAFGLAWAWEAERARSHRGLFMARSIEGDWLGFAAHSGNLCHRGTFGPIGVLPLARGRGVGAALATSVFADLHERGFDEATVPWVAAETVAFYESLVAIRGRTRRLAMTLTLSGRGSP